MSKIIDRIKETEFTAASLKNLLAVRIDDAIKYNNLDSLIENYRLIVPNLIWSKIKGGQAAGNQAETLTQAAEQWSTLSGRVRNLGNPHLWTKEDTYLSTTDTQINHHFCVLSLYQILATPEELNNKIEAILRSTKMSGQDYLLNSYTDALLWGDHQQAKPLEELFLKIPAGRNKNSNSNDSFNFSKSAHAVLLFQNAILGTLKNYTDISLSYEKFNAREPDSINLQLISFAEEVAVASLHHLNFKAKHTHQRYTHNRAFKQNFVHEHQLSSIALISQAPAMKALADKTWQDDRVEWLKKSVNPNDAGGCRSYAVFDVAAAICKKMITASIAANVMEDGFLFPPNKATIDKIKANHREAFEAHWKDWHKSLSLNNSIPLAWPFLAQTASLWWDNNNQHTPIPGMEKEDGTELAQYLQNLTRLNDAQARRIAERGVFSLLAKHYAQPSEAFLPRHPDVIATFIHAIGAGPSNWKQTKTLLSLWAAKDPAILLTPHRDLLGLTAMDYLAHRSTQIAANYKHLHFIMMLTHQLLKDQQPIATIQPIQTTALPVRTKPSKRI